MRRLIAALLAAGALAAGAAALVGGRSGSSGHGTGSTRYIYDVVEPQGSSQDTLDLQGEYLARLTTRSSAGVDLGGFAWSSSAVFTLHAGQQALESALVPPGIAGPRSRLDVVLPVAEQLGLVSRAGTGHVLGRDCTTWVSAEPLIASRFTPATADESTQTCVAADGTVLSETWTRNGTVVRTRTIRSIGPGPSLDGDRLTNGPADASHLGDQVTYTKTGADITALTGPLPVGPGGMNRDLVVLTRRGGRDTGTVSYLGRSRLVTLAVSASPQGPIPLPSEGTAIGLGAAGTGRLTLLYNGLRVSWVTPRGLLAAVTGDLPESDLLAWVRDLRIG